MSEILNNRFKADNKKVLHISGFSSSSIHLLVVQTTENKKRILKMKQVEDKWINESINDRKIITQVININFFVSDN